MATLDFAAQGKAIAVLAAIFDVLEDFLVLREFWMGPKAVSGSAPFPIFCVRA